MNISDAIISASQELKNNSNSEAAFNGIKELSENAFKNLLASMFPLHIGFENNIEKNLEKAAIDLKTVLLRVLNNPDNAEKFTSDLILKLPEIKRILWTDILAAYQGDPAAKSLDEIILAYPAFTAISAYRVAHELFLMEIPLIPRIITEYAHRLTGTDIHPGAKIGDYFFIDHATGVVIGETSTIGNHVKIYQNVTIGAKSFKVAPDGSLVKGIKRHPDIGNEVIIYAGATILGGDTVIGDKCVIGGNVWLTHSVEPGQIIQNEQ